MKFEIKTPCPECPFRRDSNPFLRRAAAIRDQMRDDHYWFACHQTTGVMRGRRIKPENQSHCMGLMRVLWKERRANIAMRLALLYEFITIAQLEARKPPVFNSLDEFVEHHQGQGNL